MNRRDFFRTTTAIAATAALPVIPVAAKVVAPTTIIAPPALLDASRRLLAMDGFEGISARMGAAMVANFNKAFWDEFTK